MLCRWLLGSVQYLLDAALLVCVRSGCGADLAAGTGGLVDESARGTRPLCLQGGSEMTQISRDSLFYVSVYK